MLNLQKKLKELKIINPPLSFNVKVDCEYEIPKLEH